MRTLKGIGVSEGCAVGRITRLTHRQRVEYKATSDPDRELGRLDAALESVRRQLDGIYEGALARLGEEDAEIFRVHRMLLDDPDYLDAVRREIRESKSTAEGAVFSACESFAAVFEGMDDAYLRARAADMRDVSDRLVDCLSGKASARSPGEKSVLCADDLSPSETVTLDTSRVLAFVTASGSASSHTAILASSLGIPAIVGVGRELLSVEDGTLAVVDGDSGILTLEPSEALLRESEERRRLLEHRRSSLLKLKGKPSRTRDGRSVLLYANVGGEGEVREALRCDAEGIGLFRSELLYLGRESAPSEEEQTLVYRRLLKEMGKRRTVVRTLDVGADKQVDYLGLPREENPALGLRGVRFCLANRSLFKTQLRALYRASGAGRLAILFPMITSERELCEVLSLCADVRRELTEAGESLCEVEHGIMIETPAAALTSDRLAPLVDFFSVGTNDLIQYTLACDRGNAAVGRFCDPHHEAVLRLIELSAKNAHAAGKWVGICGELASDATLTETFLRMGIDELSVSPSRILSLRERIRALDLSEKK